MQERCIVLLTTLQRSIDVKALQQSFSNAAEHYDRLSAWQKTVGFDLMRLFSGDLASARSVLDLGCGTGFFLDCLVDRFANANVVAVDIAEGMAARARQRHNQFPIFCADAHHLPFADNVYDAAFANLIFQWSDRLTQAFSECRRVLSGSGDLYFSILTQKTMKELRSCWSHVGDSLQLMQFENATTIIDILTSSGFNIKAFETKSYTVHYESVPSFLTAMKMLGSKNLSNSRPRGLLTKAKLARVAKAYEAYRNEAGLLPVTYEVLLIHAK